MSQESVFNCIEKAKRPICTKEMEKKLKINVSRIGEACRKLYKNGFIEKQEIVTDLGGTTYRRRVNFYSVKK